MPYFLQTFEGSESSVNFYKGKTLRIGRGTNASLRLDGPVVELEHAEIREDDHGYVLTDLSKGAGIYVNDQQGHTHRLAHGDRIEIDIPHRRIELMVPKDELAERRRSMEVKGGASWKPESRERTVSTALQAYAALTTSAAQGAVRDLSQL